MLYFIIIIIKSNNMIIITHPKNEYYNFKSL